MVLDMQRGRRQWAGLSPVTLSRPEASEAVAGYLGSLWWHLRQFLASPALPELPIQHFECNSLQPWAWRPKVVLVPGALR